MKVKLTVFDYKTYVEHLALSSPWVTLPKEYEEIATSLDNKDLELEDTVNQIRAVPYDKSRFYDITVEALASYANMKTKVLDKKGHIVMALYRNMPEEFINSSLNKEIVELYGIKFVLPQYHFWLMSYEEL